MKLIHIAECVTYTYKPCKTLFLPSVWPPVSWWAYHEFIKKNVFMLYGFLFIS